MAVAFTQVHFRGRNDDGTEVTATWKAAADTNWTQQVDTNFRVRFDCAETGTTAATLTGQLKYSKNGGAYTSVTGSSSNVKAVASSQIVDGVATTQIISSGTFVAGSIDEVDGLCAQTASMAQNVHTELEFVLQIVGADVAPADTITLRVYRSPNTAFGTYSQTPSITVQETVTRTQAGVARITATTTKTQTAVSRVTATTPKTQAGVSRVTATTTRTQPTVANVRATTNRTQPAISRVTATATQTLTAVARLLVSVLRTVTAVTRVTGITSRTQAALSRITAITSGTVSAIARITTVANQTQAGVANIQPGATDRTQSGLARISISSPQTVAGQARVTVTTSRTQPGVSRVTAITGRNQPAISSLRATATRTQAGSASVSILGAQTQDGIARLAISSARQISGLANIYGTTQRTQSGVARIIDVLEDITPAATGGAVVVSRPHHEPSVPWFKPIMGTVSLPDRVQILVVGRLTLPFLSIEATGGPRYASEADVPLGAVEVTAEGTYTPPAIFGAAAVNLNLLTVKARASHDLTPFLKREDEELLLLLDLAA